MRKILLASLLIFLIPSFIMGESKQGINISQYDALYKVGQYQDIINKLQDNFKFTQKGNSSQIPVVWIGQKINLSESDYSHLLLIIADSYRMLQKYTKSSLLYADIIGYAFGDDYSNIAEYSFIMYKKIGITEAWTPPGYVETAEIKQHYSGQFGANPQHELILEEILNKLTDNTSLNDKNKYFTELVSYDKNNDWVTELTRFCANNIPLDKLIAITPTENISTVNTYAGFYSDISGKNYIAQNLYQKALTQKKSDNIELLLAANKLGLFSLKIIYTKYGSIGKEVVNLTDIYSIKASSAKFEDNRLYTVQNLIDNNSKTAWVPDSKKSGIGEWIEISFDDPTQINNITLTNGYTKSDVTFKNNNRIKNATLIFSDGSKTKIILKDTMKPQTIKVNKKSRTIRIVIDEVYKGIKYDDTCLSGVDIDFKS